MLSLLLSWPGLTRPSAHLGRREDGRVKPGHDVAHSYRVVGVPSSRRSALRSFAAVPYKEGMDNTAAPQDASPALQRYVEQLQRWNRSINLVSARDLPLLWTRHIADSLQLGMVWSKRPEHAIDLGSGGGFPGLVLAIQYGVRFTLIEQDRGKAAFLREAVRVSGAPVTVVTSKIEDAVVPPASLITARALAPLSRLLGYAEKLLLPDGECLFLKGRGVEAEIAEAAGVFRMRIEKFPSQTNGDGAILRISEITRRDRVGSTGSSDPGSSDLDDTTRRQTQRP
jgi:16S rRNA (guanine527-N7)-methyltransferase